MRSQRLYRLRDDQLCKWAVSTPVCVECVRYAYHARESPLDAKDVWVAHDGVIKRRV